MSIIRDEIIIKPTVVRLALVLLTIKILTDFLMSPLLGQCVNFSTCTKLVLIHDWPQNIIFTIFMTYFLRKMLTIHVGDYISVGWNATNGKGKNMVFISDPFVANERGGSVVIEQGENRVRFRKFIYSSDEIGLFMERLKI